MAHSVVIVTDNQFLLKTAEAVFEETEGVVVSVLRTTQECFDKLAKAKPSLVLLDFDLPDNGALAVRRFAAKTQTACPVVLVAPESLNPEWSLVFECDTEVSRPISAESLHAALIRVGWPPSSGDSSSGTGQTVFDRVASRPRIQPYRMKPVSQHQDQREDTASRLRAIEPSTEFSSVAESGISSLPPEAPFDPDLEMIEDLITSYSARLDKKDPYYLFDVPRTVSVHEVRQRYRRIRRDLHPDRIEVLPPLERQRAKDLLARLRVAYDSIVAKLMREGFARDATPAPGFVRDKTGEQRLQELRRMSRSRPVPQPAVRKEKIDPGPGNRTPMGYAKAYYKEAQKKASANRWEEAVELVLEAIEEAPHTPELIAFEAWARFHAPNENREANLELCAERLSIALTLREVYADAHYYLGRVREKQHRHAEAVESYKRALELDPALDKHGISLRISEIAV